MNYPKPDVNPITVLRRFYCNRILPQVYDDSLSFEELLYGVLKKMNEVIEKVINEYDIDKETAKRDIEKFIKMLEDNKLLEK